MISNIIHYDFLFQSVLAFMIIIVGGTVEGYGYGLSLGTNWPYTRDMPEKAKTGDPEVWHRILATLLGINSLVLLILHFNIVTITGFILIVGTALLGMATLYTLAGKAPSVVQGLHDILAYSTALTYLIGFTDYYGNLGSFIVNTIPIYFFFLVIFMGGMTTGQRGFQKPIGYFKFPKTRAQYIWTFHGISVLLFLIVLSIYFYSYNVAILILGLQIIIGILVFIFVNKNASRPGFIVPLHQTMTILIVISIFFQLSLFKVI